MKALEYTTDFPDNGVLSLPPDLLKQMNIRKNSKVKILLLYEEDSEIKNIGRFCGKWQDERNANIIIEDIYKNRKKNTRSEDFKL